MKKLDLTTGFIYILVITLSIILPFTLSVNLGENYSLIVTPIIWIGITLLCFVFNDGIFRVRQANKKSIIKNVLIITLSYIIIYYLLGLFFGFLRTPYSHSIQSILKNIWSIVFIIILQEYVRCFLATKTEKSKISFLVITLMFILINIEWSNLYDNFETKSTAFKYICSTLLPLVITSALFTYLTLKAGSLPSIIYRTIPKIAIILVPIVPNLDWFFTSILEILTCFITFIIINYYVLNESRISKRKIKKDAPITTLPIIAICIILICFVAGIFKVMPVAVMSNSMIPEFGRGDVVITNKLSETELHTLKVGDIIEYNLDGRYIIHRIQEIVDSDNYIYITKGDNNNAADSKEVYSNQIVGKVILIIPKIGYPSVWFSNLLSITPPDDIQI